jgi:hypothetical protein
MNLELEKELRNERRAHTRSVYEKLEYVGLFF